MARKKTVKNTKKNEIIGIIIICVAVFLAVTVYFDIDSLFGTVFSNFMFGMFGVMGYLMPIIIGFIGVLVIAASKQKTNKRKLTFLWLAVFFVFAILHLAVIEKIYTSGESYLLFLQDSFEIGVVDRAGGGIIGGLLTYWTYIAMGFVGTCLVGIAGLVIFIILLANLSVKKISTDIGVAVKNTYEGYKERVVEAREQRRLYVESLQNMEKDDSDEQNSFDMRVQPGFDLDTQDFINEETDTVVKKDVHYDAKKYHEVFSDTDIVFPEDEVVEVKSRRRITIAGLKDESKKPVKKPKRQIDTEETKLEENPNIIRREDVLLPNDDDNYVYPPFDLLNIAPKKHKSHASELQNNIAILENTFKSFKIAAKVVNVSQGPTITRYEVQPDSGVKVSRIVSLADDIAMNLAARDVRIEAPVPGKAVVGIEIPNQKTSAVGLKELLESEKFISHKSKIAFAIGKDISGENVYADIAKMPHLLIAGATGSGKSVCINSLIISILYHATPKDVRMIMIDPKVVELNAYNGIPHLMIPVVTDPKKAASAITWAVSEMTLRYRMFAQEGAKDLAKYNELIEAKDKEKLPQIVVIIDELADLMMVAPRDVEDAICRIAQLGRASGIHLVIATQRPSVNVITGIIKANIPSRIAFAVSSNVDSRTILDMQGAEKLLGQGDMLYYPAGIPKPVRVQGGFISEKEVQAVCEFLKSKQESSYDDSFIEKVEQQSAEIYAEEDERDKLFSSAAEIVMDLESASTSMLQRKLKIGYARAARLIDQMEEAGIVSAPDGSKPRQVLLSKEQIQEILDFNDAKKE